MKRRIKILSLAAAMLLLVSSCNEGENAMTTTAEPVTSAESTALTEETSGETVTEEPTAEVTEPVKTKSDELAEILRSGSDLQATAVKQFKVERPYSTQNSSLLLTACQGGTRVGNFHYQCFVKTDTSNEANNIVRVVKYNTNKKAAVKYSKDLSLCHANDITYVPEDNLLYIVHNAPYRKQVSVLNADTLEYIETKTLPLDIYCMTYQTEKQKFVVGMSGGQNFVMLNKDLSRSGKIHTATTLTTGYVTQGCSSDENFIYFVLYKENVITVYDWDGNFVTLIHFDVGSIEPENISVVDGEIFVTCGNTGAEVYKITPKAAQ